MKIAKEDLQLLEDIRQTYIKSADNVVGWKTMNKNKLANLYLEYEHTEPERSYYFSALMCRYWSNVYKFYRASRSTRLDISDFTTWLAEAFFVAFKYRKWKDSSSKLYNDPQAPDKVINRCIYSTRMRYYQYYNMNKRKINFQTDSIERQIEVFGPMADVHNYMISEDENKSDAKCKELITHYLSKNNIFMAIILDLICFNDTFRETRKVQTFEIENVMTEGLETEDDDFELSEIDDELLFVDTTLDDVEEFIENDDVLFDDEETAEEEDNKKTDYKLAEKKVIYEFEFSPRKLLSVLREIDDEYRKYFLNVYEADELAFVSTIKQIQELSLRRKLAEVVNKMITQASEDKKVHEILCS